MRCPRYYGRGSLEFQGPRLSVVSAEFSVFVYLSLLCELSTAKDQTARQRPQPHAAFFTIRIRIIFDLFDLNVSVDLVLSRAFGWTLGGEFDSETRASG